MHCRADNARVATLYAAEAGGMTRINTRHRLHGALGAVALLPLLLGAVAPTATAALAPGGDPQEPAPTVRFEVPPPVPNEAWHDDTVEIRIVGSSRIGSVESITWTASGAQSGGATVAGSSVAVTIDAQGVTRVSATAADSDGNVSEEFDVLIKIDRTPPTMVVTAPAPGAHRFGSPIYIDYVCADPESGIDRTNIDQCFVDFYLDGVRQGGAQTDSTWMPREEGLYEVRAWAANNSGLETRIVVGMVNVILNETVAPDVTISAPPVPASGWYAEPVTLRMDAVDAGAGVEYVDVRSRGAGAWSEWVRVAAATTTAVVAETGTHQYESRAVDYFGNVSATTQYTLSLDVTAPAVTIEGPADGIRIAQGGDLVAEYSCTDAGSGVESCDGTVDSGELLDTSEAGTFTWSATAIDTAGNLTRVERTYTVFVPDTEGPTVLVDAPGVPASGWYTTPPRITFTASDSSGVDQLRWTYTGSRGQQASGSETSGTWSIDDFTDGLSTISYYAIDGLGNEGPQQTLEVRVDRDAPWIVIDSPAADVALVADDDIVRGTAVDFEFRCDDAASGVAGCVSSVGDTLPTDVVGTHEVTVTAVDRAGHRQVETLEYTVVAAPQPQPNGGGTAGGAGRGLAATGVEPAGALLAALGLLALGGLAGVAARRRSLAG